MKTKVKALQKFYHGNKMVEQGRPDHFSKGEAEELAKAGLVEIVDDKAIDTPRLQDVKMADAPENKMADTPANKSRSKKAD